MSDTNWSIPMKSFIRGADLVMRNDEAERVVPLSCFAGLPDDQKERLRERLVESMSEDLLSEVAQYLRSRGSES